MSKSKGYVNDQTISEYTEGSPGKGMLRGTTPYSNLNDNAYGVEANFMSMAAEARMKSENHLLIPPAT